MLLKKKNHQPDQDKLTKEINTEIRKERIKAKLRKHKKIIAYILIAILLLLIAMTAFNIYQKSQEEKYSAVLQQVLVDTGKGNSDAAKTALKKLYENSAVPSGIKSLVSLKYATSLLGDEKFDEALDVYLKANKNKKFDPYARELAGLLALKFMVDSNDGNFNEKIVSLEKELEKSSKILKYFIIEQKAVFEWNQKNYDAAGVIFKDLASNPEVSGSLKAHSKEMSDIYSSKYSTKDNVDKKSEVKSGGAEAAANKTNK